MSQKTEYSFNVNKYIGATHPLLYFYVSILRAYRNVNDRHTIVDCAHRNYVLLMHTFCYLYLNKQDSLLLSVFVWKSLAGGFYSEVYNTRTLQKD
jgi:hypothetical protein